MRQFLIVFPYYKYGRDILLSNLTKVTQLLNSVAGNISYIILSVIQGKKHK